MESKGLSKFSIRTSDRRVFRRCLRKWNWQSSLRQNLTHRGAESNINFWFGSAIHFAMEDWGGFNRFEDPRRALWAYYESFPESERPAGAEVHYDLGMSMLTYYLQWIKRHNEATGFETLWVYEGTYEPCDKNAPGAVPAVEIQFYLPLDVYAIVNCQEGRIVGHFDKEHIPMWLDSVWSPEDDPEQEYFLGGITYKIVPIYYHGTIDRIVRDKYGRFWLWDYKTAKRADTAKLPTDDQVSAYLWAARKLFPFKVYGFVYLQMTKNKPQEPKRLKNGDLSCDKRQSTTYALYRQALIEDYGDVNHAPSKMIETLNHFASIEEPEGDQFCRWDFVKRTDAQLDATERAIRGELEIMLNPDLYCYPSPTRDCSWDCPFQEACVMTDMDDAPGLQDFFMNFVQRPHGEDGNQEEWRANIPWPKAGEELISMDDVLHYDFGEILKVNFTEEPESGFKFLYGDEDDNI